MVYFERSRGVPAQVGAGGARENLSHFEALVAARRPMKMVATRENEKGESQSRLLARARFGRVTARYSAVLEAR